MALTDPSTAWLGRFWSKVDKTAGCWLWTAAKSQLGYGQFNAGLIDGRKRYRPAHRIAWELLRGEIPSGLVLDHLCRVPSCVNPDHLEPVTQRANVLRGAHPKAIAFRNGTCVRGHDAANFYRRNGTGAVVCSRVCAAAKARERRRA